MTRFTDQIVNLIGEHFSAARFNLGTSSTIENYQILSKKIKAIEKIL